MPTTPKRSPEAANLALGRGAHDEIRSLGTMGIIEERVALLFGSQLEHQLQERVQVGAESAGVVKFGEWARALEDPGCHNLLELDALGGHALVSIERPLFFSLLEGFLGGGGAPAAAASGRERLSAVEERVARRIVRLWARAMESAWRPIVPLHVAHLRVESRPNSVAISGADEPVVATEFGVRAGAAEGRVRLAIPKASVWRFRERLATGRYEEAPSGEESWRGALGASLVDVPLRVSAELGRAKMTLGEFSALATGSIIRLDRAPTTPTLVRVEGVPKYLATTKVAHGNLAVELHDLWPPSGAALDLKAPAPGGAAASPRPDENP